MRSAASATARRRYETAANRASPDSCRVHGDCASAHRARAAPVHASVRRSTAECAEAWYRARRPRARRAGVRTGRAAASPAANSYSTIERFRQTLRQALASLAAQRPSALFGDVEDVFRALADGHDLRRVDVDAFAHEYLGTLRQQAGPVAGDGLDDRALVDRVLAEGDLRRRREHPHLPRRAPSHGDGRIVGLGQCVLDLLLDVAGTYVIGDLR